VEYDKQKLQEQLDIIEVHLLCTAGHMKISVPGIFAQYEDAFGEMLDALVATKKELGLSTQLKKIVEVEEASEATQTHS
jgi:hypothetical protein